MLNKTPALVVLAALGSPTLGACVPPKQATASHDSRADAADSSTTSGDSATADTGPGESRTPDSGRLDTGRWSANCALPADVPPLACALTNPGPVDPSTTDSIVHVLLGDPIRLGLDAFAWDARWDCTYASDRTSYETFTGDCSDHGGTTWSGTAGWVWDGTEELWTFTDFREDTAAGESFWWNGTVTYLKVAGGYSSNANLSFSVSGSTDPDLPNGAFSHVGLKAYANGALGLDGTVTADGKDWCIAAEVDESCLSADCKNRSGWWQVVGDRSATLVEDGAAEGCPCGCWDPSDGDPQAFCGG